MCGAIQRWMCLLLMLQSVSALLLNSSDVQLEHITLTSKLTVLVTPESKAIRIYNCSLSAGMVVIFPPDVRTTPDISIEGNTFLTNGVEFRGDQSHIINISHFTVVQRNILPLVRVNISIIKNQFSTGVISFMALHIATESEIHSPNWTAERTAASQPQPHVLIKQNNLQNCGPGGCLVFQSTVFDRHSAVVVVGNQLISNTLAARSEARSIYLRRTLFTNSSALILIRNYVHVNCGWSRPLNWGTFVAESTTFELDALVFPFQNIFYAYQEPWSTSSFSRNFVFSSSTVFLPYRQGSMSCATQRVIRYYSEPYYARNPYNANLSITPTMSFCQTEQSRDESQVTAPLIEWGFNEIITECKALQVIDVHHGSVVTIQFFAGLLSNTLSHRNSNYYGNSPTDLQHILHAPSCNVVIGNFSASNFGITFENNETLLNATGSLWTLAQTVEGSRANLTIHRYGPNVAQNLLTVRNLRTKYFTVDSCVNRQLKIYTSAPPLCGYWKIYKNRFVGAENAAYGLSLDNVRLDGGIIAISNNVINLWGSFYQFGMRFQNINAYNGGVLEIVGNYVSAASVDRAYALWWSNLYFKDSSYVAMESNTFIGSGDSGVTRAVGYVFNFTAGEIEYHPYYATANGSNSFTATKYSTAYPWQYGFVSTSDANISYAFLSYLLRRSSLLSHAVITGIIPLSAGVQDPGIQDCSVSNLQLWSKHRLGTNCTAPLSSQFKWIGGTIGYLSILNFDCLSTFRLEKVLITNHIALYSLWSPDVFPSQWEISDVSVGQGQPSSAAYGMYIRDMRLNTGASLSMSRNIFRQNVNKGGIYFSKLLVAPLANINISSHNHACWGTGSFLGVFTFDLAEFSPNSSLIIHRAIVSLRRCCALSQWHGDVVKFMGSRLNGTLFQISESKLNSNDGDYSVNPIDFSSDTTVVASTISLFQTSVFGQLVFNLNTSNVILLRYVELVVGRWGPGQPWGTSAYASFSNVKNNTFNFSCIWYNGNYYKGYSFLGVDKFSSSSATGCVQPNISFALGCSTLNLSSAGRGADNSEYWYWRAQFPSTMLLCPSLAGHSELLQPVDGNRSCAFAQPCSDPQEESLKKIRDRTIFHLSLPQAGRRLCTPLTPTHSFFPTITVSAASHSPSLSFKANNVRPSTSKTPSNVSATEEGLPISTTLFDARVTGLSHSQTFSWTREDEPINVKKEASTPTVSIPRSLNNRNISTTLTNNVAPPLGSKRRETPLQRVIGVKSSKAMATSQFPTMFAIGLITPSAANKALTVTRLLNTANCMSLDDDDDILNPPWHQYILPIPVSIGSYDPLFKRANGAILFTTALLIVSVIACGLVAWKAQPAHQSPRKCAGVLFAVMLSFYGPNIASLGTTILFLSSSGSERILAGVCLGICIILFFIPVGFLARLSDDACKRCHQYFSFSLDGTNNGLTEEEHRSVFTSFPWLLTPMLESARDPLPQHIRHHVNEDVFAALMVGFLSGISPPPSWSCLPPAIMMLVVCVAHAAYVVLCSPYLEKLEQFFAALLAGLQCVLAVAMVIIVAAPDVPSSFVSAVGWLAILINCLFYVQLIVLSVAEAKKFIRFQRKLKNLAEQNVDDANDDNSIPLLTVPPAQQQQSSNPLDSNLES